MRAYRLISTAMHRPPLDLVANGVTEALEVAARKGWLVAERLQDGRHAFDVRRLDTHSEYWIAFSRRPRPVIGPHKPGDRVSTLIWPRLAR